MMHVVYEIRVTLSSRILLLPPVCRRRDRRAGCRPSTGPKIDDIDAVRAHGDGKAAD
jgi:hypothetical protein